MQQKQKFEKSAPLAFKELPSTMSAGATSWVKNRSFFLRLTENRRKQHKREWESKKATTIWERCSSVLPLPQRETSSTGLIDELQEAKDVIKMQQSQIESLRNEISVAQEGKMEQECSRVEAEVYRVNAENESRILKATIEELKKMLEEKAHEEGSIQNMLNQVECSLRSTTEPKDISLYQIGDAVHTPASKESCDQGYDSMPRQSNDVSITSSHPSSYQFQLPQPATGLPFQQQYDSENDSFFTKQHSSRATSTDDLNPELITVECQTDLLGYIFANSYFTNKAVLSRSNLRKEVGDKLPLCPKKHRKSSRLICVFSNALFAYALLQGFYENALDMENAFRKRHSAPAEGDL